MGTKILLKNVRLAFANIFEPAALPSDPTNLAYGAKFPIPQDHPQVKEIEAAMLAEAKAEWKDKGQAVFDNMTKTGRKPDVPFVKAPYTNIDGAVYDGFQGAFTLSARNGGKVPLKPTAFDAQNHLVSQADGVVYPGCYVDASIEIYAVDNTFGRRLSCSLRGIRKVADGDAFGGGTKASAEEFGAPLEAEDFV
jgi:hypothetical protein